VCNVIREEFPLSTTAMAVLLRQAGGWEEVVVHGGGGAWCKVHGIAMPPPGFALILWREINF
jgi:hypothetical protein